MTDKVKGKVTDHEKYEVSPDGRTLTMTVKGAGPTNTQSYVYDKILIEQRVTSGPPKLTTKL